jgi:hypothetical protein
VATAFNSIAQVEKKVDKNCARGVRATAATATKTSEDARGRDIRAAAEPPDATICLKITVVEVHRRGHRIARVHHRREPAREERHTLAWGRSIKSGDR